MALASVSFAGGDCSNLVLRVRMVTAGGGDVSGYIKHEVRRERGFAIGQMVFNPFGGDEFSILQIVGREKIEPQLAAKLLPGERVLAAHRSVIDTAGIVACDLSGSRQNLGRTQAECDAESSDRRGRVVAYADTFHRWTAPRSISSVWGLRSCRSGGRGLERLKLSEPFRMLYARSRRIDLDTVRLVVTSDSLTWCDAYDPLHMVPGSVFARLATGKPLAHWRFVRCEDGFELDLVGYSPEWNAARLSASVDPVAVESVLTESDHMERDCLRRYSSPLRKAVERGEVLQFVVGTP